MSFTTNINSQYELNCSCVYTFAALDPSKSEVIDIKEYELINNTIYAENENGNSQAVIL